MVYKRKGKKKQKPFVLTPEDFFSRDERKKLLKTCREKAELDLLHGKKTWVARYMLVDLALYSGLRVAEIASLKIGDLCLKNGDPYLIVRKGKGDKKRVVYLDNGLTKHLKEFLQYKERSLLQSIEPDQPLFKGQKGDHSPPITLMKSFKTACETAGLRKKLSIHSARHTYATFLLHDTGNLRYVQQQLGHSSIAMTSHYANILPEENGKLANLIERED